MSRLDDIKHQLAVDAEYDDDDTWAVAIGDTRWLVTQVTELEEVSFIKSQYLLKEREVSEARIGELEVLNNRWLDDKDALAGQIADLLAALERIRSWGDSQWCSAVAEDAIAAHQASGASVGPVGGAAAPGTIPAHQGEEG